MTVKFQLGKLLADRKMTLKELSSKVELTSVNLSAYKTGKVRAVRISTLDILCKTLHCQPGDLFEYIPDEDEEKSQENSNQAPSGPPPLEFDIGEAVKQLRSETGLSQKEFAQECGVRTSIIDKLESGDLNISMQALNQIAERLGKHLEFRLAARFV